jgi:hypothetical protein
MTLLIAICGAMGVVSYASMDAFLTRSSTNSSARPRTGRTIRAARPWAASMEGTRWTPAASAWAP